MDELNPFQLTVETATSWEQAEAHVGLQRIEDEQVLRAHRPVKPDLPRTAQSTLLVSQRIQPSQLIHHIQTIWNDLGIYPSFDNTWRLQPVAMTERSGEFLAQADVEYVLRAETDLTLGQDLFSAVLVEVIFGDRQYCFVLEFAVAAIKVLTAEAFLEQYVAPLDLPEQVLIQLRRNDESWELAELLRLWHGDRVQVQFYPASLPRVEHNLLNEPERARSRSPPLENHRTSTAIQDQGQGQACVLSPGQGSYRRAKIEIDIPARSTENCNFADLGQAWSTR